MTSVKQFLLSLFAISIFSLNFNTLANTQSQILWQQNAQPHPQDSMQYLAQLDKVNVIARSYRLLNLDINQLMQQLQNKNNSQYILALPLPDGTLVQFELTYSPIYESKFAQKFPTIRTFKGHQVNQPQNKGRFDITPHGFHAMFRYNSQLVFIDPLQRGNNRQYISYYKHHTINDHQPQLDEVRIKQAVKKVTEPVRMANETLRTYRLAIAVTAEYTQFHGGTVELGQSAIVTTVNRVNEIYNNDVAVQLNLVADNDQLVFTDSSTDPFNNDENDIDLVQQVIDTRIGNANYDLGHVMTTSDGGIAALGVVCFNPQKAEGLTGSPSPTGDPFDIDYVAHELGHQFGAEHTFNGTESSCINRESTAAYEPGSGSTIMAYAGICGSQNIQNNSDAYFHSHSIDQINQYISGDGDACSSNTSLNNQAPTVDAGSDYTIPASTPFMLSGSASDNNGDNLKYNWEQFDLGSESTSNNDMVDNGSRPLFRSFSPSDSAMRYLPQLSDILDNTTTLGETMATTSRDLTFRLMTRDQVGNTAYDTAVITVDSNSGPFSITSPDSNTSWTGNNNVTVNWNVANTNQTPVNCSQVNIMLSTDSGQTFATTLLSGTSNDGTETVTAPNITSTTARVKVKCHDNIFFAINAGDFTINTSGGGGDNEAPQITDAQVLNIDEDNSIEINIEQLTIVDNDTSTADMTLQIDDGTNYSVNGNIVTPNLNFNGQLAVPLRVNDGFSDSNTYTMTINVAAVNDAPVINSSATISMEEDSSTLLVLAQYNVTDVDNNLSELRLIIHPGDNYQINNNGNAITPTANYFGALQVPVSAFDGTANSEIFNTNIEVTPVDDPPNLLSVANQTIDEDNSLTITQDMLSVSDIDTPIASLTIQVETGDNYSVNNTTITPDEHWSGTLMIELSVADSTHSSNSRSMTVTVNPVNDAPMAVNDSISVSENSQANTIAVLNNDSDVEQDPLTVVEINYTGSGTATIATEGIIYTPATDFSGNETLSYTVEDGQGGSATATVSITVVAINNPTPPNNNDSGGGGTLSISLIGLLLLIRRLRPSLVSQT